MDLKNYKDEIVSHNGVENVILSPGVQHHGLIVNPTAGRFSKSEVRRLDVAFPAIHGTHGEDGTLQGLLEMAGVPCLGSDGLCLSAALDKTMKELTTRASGPAG